MSKIKNKWDRKDLSVNNYLYNTYKSGIVTGPDGNKYKFKDVTSPEEGRFIYDIIHTHKFKNTMEIGLAMGASAVWICQAHKDNKLGGHHIAIDPNQSTEYKNIGLNLIKKCGLNNFLSLIENFSYSALPFVLENVNSLAIKKFDLIYIDGWHTFDYTLIDFFYSDKLLKIGGIIIIDDVRHSGVKKCVEYILKNYKHYKIIKNNLVTNIALIKTDEDRREWFFHINF